MRVVASSAQQLLQAARPAVTSVPSAPSCQHPTKPAPLRRLCQFSEPCIELLVASSSTGSPCCILPSTALRSRQSSGLYNLLRLDRLDATTVVNMLAAVEGHVANACAACPSALASDEPRASPLVYLPEFACFLERCLELAQMHKDLGPAPAVLLLQIVSRLNYAADESLRDNFNRYYLHLQVALDSAVELHTEAITPQVALAVFEAWAAMGAMPMRSRSFGLALREHIKSGNGFAPQELSRLLAAMAALRNAHPSYRPCQYDVCDICSLLSFNLQELAEPHMTSVAFSLASFPWPVYQCVLPLLDGVAEEAVRRMVAGEMSLPCGQTLLATAVNSATQLNPRLGAELEAKVAGWKAQARLCTGNILSFEAAAAPGVSTFL